MSTRFIGPSTVAFVATALPVLASAATLTDTIALASSFLNATIGLFITLAIVVFFWGIIQYLIGDGAEGKSNGIKIMFWGVLSIFVMVSIWGIIRLLPLHVGVGYVYDSPQFR